jgi:hypothetical protein
MKCLTTWPITENLIEKLHYITAILCCLKTSCMKARSIGFQIIDFCIKFNELTFCGKNVVDVSFDICEGLF